MDVKEMKTRLISILPKSSHSPILARYMVTQILVQIHMIGRMQRATQRWAWGCRPDPMRRCAQSRLWDSATQLTTRRWDGRAQRISGLVMISISIMSIAMRTLRIRFNTKDRPRKLESRPRYNQTSYMRIFPWDQNCKRLIQSRLMYAQRAWCAEAKRKWI